MTTAEIASKLSLLLEAYESGQLLADDVEHHVTEHLDDASITDRQREIAADLARGLIGADTNDTRRLEALDALKRFVSDL